MAAREQEGGDGGEDNMSASEEADKDWGGCSIGHCFCFMTEARGGDMRDNLSLIYLKGTLGIWREEKTDEKFWRGAQVYRQTSLLEIGRRVKCKISF